jgi:uncharacterized protein YceK
VPGRRAFLVYLGSLLLLAGCSSLLSSEPTPVPGAAATLTRSSRTPIPTPLRTPSPVGIASPSPGRAAAASPSANVGGRLVTAEEINELRQQIDRSLASPDLPGIESLLLDRVLLSSTEGGQELDRAGAASWLRDHAGPGLQVVRIERSALSVLLEVLTEGWPDLPPVTDGTVTFNLHRYDASGKQDEDNGNWKIDVIGAG